MRGLLDEKENQQRDITEAIGRDERVKDLCLMCTSTDPHCVSARNAHTTLFLLQHGRYDGEPASKVLLIPHTGNPKLSCIPSLTGKFNQRKAQVSQFLGC